MISRIWTCLNHRNEIEAEYKGFNRQFRDASVVALTMDSGEVELWALDDGPEAVQNFNDYIKWRNDSQGCSIAILGIYRK